VRVLRFPRIALAVFCFNFLILSTAALANDYYVAPTGSDSGAGSQASPWKTISHAIGAFSLGSNGAVIHVAAGTYASGIDITRGGSSPTVRLVLQCDPGAASATDAMGQCKITGSASGIMVEANNVDVVGFDIGGNASMGIGLNSVCNPSGSTVACTTGNSNHFIGNYVHDLASSVPNSVGIVGCPENGAIQVGSNQHGHTTTDPQAIRNFVLNFGTNPAPTGCNTAQGVYFGSTGSGSSAIIQNNLIIKAPVSGITNSDNLCNEVITNNTIISTKAGIILSGDGTNCPGGVPGHNTIANNAIFNSTNEQVFNVGSTVDCSSGAPTLWSHNVSDGLKADFSPSRASCDTVTPTPWVHQAGSAFFVNYQTDGSGDYHLQSSSIGIAAGSTTCVSGGMSPCMPATDFDGIARAATVSLGAFDVAESGSLPTAPTGLTAQVQ